MINSITSEKKVCLNSLSTCERKKQMWKWNELTWPCGAANTRQKTCLSRKNVKSFFFDASAFETYSSAFFFLFFFFTLFISSCNFFQSHAKRNCLCSIAYSRLTSHRLALNHWLLLLLLIKWQAANAASERRDELTFMEKKNRFKVITLENDHKHLYLMSQWDGDQSALNSLAPSSAITFFVFLVFFSCISKNLAGQNKILTAKTFLSLHRVMDVSGFSSCNVECQRIRLCRSSWHLSRHIGASTKKSFRLSFFYTYIFSGFSVLNVFCFVFFLSAELRLRQRGNGKALRKGSEAPSVLSRGRFQRRAGGGGGSGGTMLFRANQRPRLVHTVLLKITLHTPSTVNHLTLMSSLAVFPPLGPRKRCSKLLPWLGDLGGADRADICSLWMWPLSTWNPHQCSWPTTRL